ncbi:hypothetical protein QJQ45_021078 [Haematococcus lacustris]|nr:hypothetical protein QJQ45_021078 [Haematococcus lacustris]
MHVSRGKQVQARATAELRGPLTARARLSALQWLKNRDPTELRRCATDQRRSSHCLCPAWVCRATAAVPGGQDAPSLADGSVSIILLAGGVGKRMGASIPKQYLDLRGSPIATYSLRTFSKMREVLEIIIVGAAVLGVPVKPTIKEVDAQGLVVKTLQRSKLWEVQTPQVIRTELLRNGFALVKAQGLDVTDDVSIIEALGKPVRVTPGSYTNIKISNILNPVNGVREAQARQGIKPYDHARSNAMAVKEASQLNALRKAAVEEQEKLQGGVLQEDDAAKYLQKKDYGRIPSYLLDRKLELAEQVADAQRAKEAALIPPGMRLLPEEERLETLSILERNRVDVERALQSMPIVIETPSQIRRKDEMERRLPRDWWVTQCGSGAEEFDGGCLCLGNIDNDPHEAVKLATGSLSGVLRIYQPKDRDFKPEDLLLEQELEQAILQLELAHGLQVVCGMMFCCSMEGMQLAVLHPRKLAVYLVRNMGTQYLQASKLYEHPMEHTAANMCFGSFGGVQGQDYICVQSYDGQLSFYECESFAFARYLPSFLIPGPLAYVAASDSFVTCSAGFELECYKYKSLAAASGEKQAEGKPVGGANLQVGKRVTADWKVILGESAVDLRCGRLSKGLQAYQADIVVLCEHHVFVVSSTTGAIIFQKRLEYHPACCTTYPAAESKLPGGLENLLVASHNKALLVYRGNVLCWAARMDSQPVAVKVADISTSTGLQKGMLVTLTDTGGLQVSYLGTDPMLNPVGFVEGKDLDYEAMGREQRALATIIREHAQGKRVEPFDRLMMRAQVEGSEGSEGSEGAGGGVPAVFDHLRDGEGAGHEALSRPGSSSNNHEGVVGGLGPGRIRPQLTLRLIINYQLTAWGRLACAHLPMHCQGSASSLDSVTVTVKAPAPVSIMQDTFHLRNVKSDPNDPSIVPITFQAASATCLPASATALIVASFAAGNGEPRAQMLEVALPLCLFVTAVPAAKNAAYKITVSVNRAPPLLGALFKDMLALASPGVAQASASGAAGANVLTFQYPTGMTATILVSKNAARFRLQSDALEALWLVRGTAGAGTGTGRGEGEGGRGEGGR